MKKLSVLLLALLVLTACGQKNDEKIIKVASHMEPMTDVVKVAAEEIKASGYEIELINVSDNKQANVALNDGEVDANFFQHVPFMEAFNTATNGQLVGIAPIYDAKVGFYSKTFNSKDEIKEGAKVAIPNDDANQARALLILQDHKLLTLTPGKVRDARIEDIVDNPLNLEFVDVDLLTLTHAYEEVDMVFNYPTYIGKIGLKPADALMLENSDTYYSISLVAREDNKDSDKIKALTKAMQSEAVKNFLETEHGDTLVPSF
ncbi:MAG TPA: MetQ/NlpA family ABC transporter substrate-binding protein [Erysipelothrix sp.]